MSSYGQFCPVAKATEVFANRWTPLIVRELLSGSHRFNDLSRGVPLMSRSLLSRRLKEMETAGLVERRKGRDGRGSEYHLTEAGLELQPIVEMLGVWGMRWVQSEIGDEDLDASLLMWDIRRRLRPQNVPTGRAVIAFVFSDAPAGKRQWWLVIEGGDPELCLADPGFDVDVTVQSDLRTMTELWLGRLDVRGATRGGTFELIGSPSMVRAFPDWIGLSLFARADRAGSLLEAVPLPA